MKWTEQHDKWSAVWPDTTEGSLRIELKILFFERRSRTVNLKVSRNLLGVWSTHMNEISGKWGQIFFVFELQYNLYCIRTIGIIKLTSLAPKSPLFRCKEGVWSSILFCPGPLTALRNHKGACKRQVLEISVTSRILFEFKVALKIILVLTYLIISSWGLVLDHFIKLGKHFSFVHSDI